MSATTGGRRRRGQARLPDPELIRIDALIPAERHSSGEQLSKLGHLSGWEGGPSTPAGLPRRGPRLAPAPGDFQILVIRVNPWFCHE